jgi:hypothetical protein
MSNECHAVRKALERDGLLLLQDKVLRSVAAIIAGETISGSWWSHPKSQVIFNCLESLEDGGDVVVTRLVGGKVTYVHRTLWPPLLTVATSSGKWQTNGLKERNAKTLQERLLMHGEEVHTASGKHETVLQPWSDWGAKHGVARMSAIDAAREHLEAAVMQIGGKATMLPWHRFA